MEPARPRAEVSPSARGRAGSNSACTAQSDKRALEFGRGYSVFFHPNRQSDPRFTFEAKQLAERMQARRFRTRADRADDGADRMQKADRTLANDDVRRRLLNFQPKQSVTGEGGDGVDAAAECGSEMIGIERDRSFDGESVVIVSDHADAHRARQRDLRAKKFFRLTQLIL